jgi:hypothetical protein
MTDFPLHGGCSCGSVRFELLGAPLSVQHCHCETCRKLTGTFFASGAVVRKADVKIGGAENLTGYRSSPSFERLFCRVCGGQLFSYEDSEDEVMYLSVAAIDGGKYPGHPPGSESHIYAGSKAEWETIGGGLPQYEKSAPGEIITKQQRSEGY